MRSCSRVDAAITRRHSGFQGREAPGGGAAYERAAASANYRGEFHPGPHRFDRAMQAAAFDWLRDRLAEGFET